MAGTTAESIYIFLMWMISCPSNRKNAGNISWGKKDQFLFDKTVLRDCWKTYKSGNGMTYFKKAYMLPHSWILESLELVQVYDNILEFVKRSKTNWWKTEMTSCGESLAKVNIRVTVYCLCYLWYA